MDKTGVMRLRTVGKLSIILSVVLFCTAVGFYTFVLLSAANKEKDINLFSLVPANCTGVLESDNIGYFLNEFPELSYAEELRNLRSPGLAAYVLGGLSESATRTAHGLSGKMSRVAISFHAPGSPRDQVIYFRMGDGDEEALDKMPWKRAEENFPPKEETYRGKDIRIYPLADGDFLSIYSERGFLAMSHQKRLIEQVIDAKEDENKSLAADPVFREATNKRKSRGFLTVYGHSAPMPLLEDSVPCWSEFDFHMNSDVAYLAGETFMPAACDCLSRIPEKLSSVPEIHEDSLILSTDRESMARLMDEAGLDTTRCLFAQCVANLSREAMFTLVADMDKVAANPERFSPYLHPFLLKNTSLLHSFILSAQLSCVNDRLSHIMVLTYKN